MPGCKPRVCIGQSQTLVGSLKVCRKYPPQLLTINPVQAVCVNNLPVHVSSLSLCLVEQRKLHVAPPPQFCSTTLATCSSITSILLHYTGYMQLHNTDYMWLHHLNSGPLHWLHVAPSPQFWSITLATCSSIASILSITLSVLQLPGHFLAASESVS